MCCRSRVPDHMHPIANALGFQLGWWTTIVLVSSGWDLLSVLPGVLLALCHLRWSQTTRADLQLALAVVTLGIGVDSLLQFMSLIHFSGWSCWHLSPPWMWSLWLQFSLTLNSSLGFLQHVSRPWVVLIGGLAGPASYLGGAALGAAYMERSFATLLSVAVTWMVALPVTVGMATSTHRSGLPDQPRT
jgi:hypothetical protein